MYHEIIIQDKLCSFSRDSRKGSQISAAGTSLIDVGMLVEDASRDVLFFLRAQHSRLIFLLLLRLKETSIQLVQGNK